MIKELHLDGVLALSIGRKYYLPLSHFYRYLQIRHFVQKGYHPFSEIPPETPIDTLSAIDFNLKGTIKKIYTVLGNMNLSPWIASELSGNETLSAFP